MDQITVWNMALSECEIGRTVESPEERTKEALTIRKFWHQARREVLAYHDWGFAVRSVRMGLLSEVGVFSAGAFADAFADAFAKKAVIPEVRGFINTSMHWKYAYKMPDDCIAPREIVNPAVKTPRSDQRIAWDQGTEQIVYTGQYYRVVYSNQPAAVLRYTADEQDLSLWTPLAVRALAFMLGTFIAGPLAASRALKGDCWNGFLRAVNAASAANKNERQEEPEPESSYIAARM